jgi:hypothetical protein
MDIDDEIIVMLRSMRDGGYTTSAMLTALIIELRKHGTKYKPINWACISAFRLAFGLGLGQTTVINSWHGWNSNVYGCNRSDADLNSQLDPLIHK